MKQRMLSTWSSKYSKLQATIWWKTEAISSQCTCFCPKSRPRICEVVQLFQVLPTAAPLYLFSSQIKLLWRQVMRILHLKLSNGRRCPVISTRLFLLNPNALTPFEMWQGCMMFQRLTIFCARQIFYPQSLSFTKSLSLLMEYSPRMDMMHYSKPFMLYPLINIANYSCGCYIFVIGCHNGQYFLMDTRAISKGLWGVGTGLLKVYPAQDSQSASHLSSWIWKRLQLGGVQEKSPQSFLVLQESDG